METPWLAIPLEEYEAHMALSSIGQAAMLADDLSRVLERYRPTSLAVIGCAGGNGLEQVDPHKVRRVVAVDINPAYLGVVRQRHGPRFPVLELHCSDAASQTLRFEAVDLIHAGLVFEYVDVPATLAALKRNCRTGGHLAVVLQRPAPARSAVSPSPFPSIQSLARIIKLVEPAAFRTLAAAAGFICDHEVTVTLASGKSFVCGVFRACD